MTLWHKSKKEALTMEDNPSPLMSLTTVGVDFSVGAAAARVESQE